MQEGDAMGGSLADAWHPPMLIEAIKGDTRRQDAIVENIQHSGCGDLALSCQQLYFYNFRFILISSC